MEVFVCIDNFKVYFYKIGVLFLFLSKYTVFLKFGVSKILFIEINQYFYSARTHSIGNKYPQRYL